MNEFLFTYGTLQQDIVQLELFGRLLSGAKDSLPGFTASPIRIQDETFLVDLHEEYLILHRDQDVNACVKGTVYELTAEELALADAYEPREYKRVAVTLQSGKQAWVYIASGEE